MPRFNEIINNFINGEISPKFYGRSDTEIYKRSCRSIENMVIHPQGGASRRMGTEFVANGFANSTATPFTDRTRIIPFVYSKDEEYLLFITENTDNYFLKVYNPTDDLWIEVFFNGGSGAGWGGDSIGLGTNLSANDLSDDSTISEIQYAQNGAVMIFAHRDFPPFYIARVGRNLFAAADYYRPYYLQNGAVSQTNEWQKFPFFNVNTTSTTIAITSGTAAVGAGKTFTASTAIFNENMVNTYFVSSNSGTVGVAYITGYTSPTVVTGTIVQAFSATTANTAWSFQCWSYTYGFPRAVSFSSDQRVLFGFTKAEPEKVWFSQTGDIFELSNNSLLGSATLPVQSDPGSFTPFSTEANEGLWIHGGARNVLIGTRGREYAVSDLSGTGITARVLPQTSYGSENVRPVAVDDIPIFVQRGFRKLREMAFDYRSEGYTAIDTTFLAENIFAKSQQILGDANVAKVKYMEYQALDNNVVWVVDTNGYLYGLTRSRENQVNAFHRHELGGSFGDDFPKVLSLASISSINGTFDELYLIVKRTVDGNTVRYLEKMGKQFVSTELHSNLEVREGQPIFSDCAKIFRPRQAQFWADLKTSSTARAFVGSGTGTTTGTITYTNGVASMDAPSSYITWDGTGNADFAQTGCIEFYIGGTVTDITTAIEITQAAASTNNQIELVFDYDVFTGFISVFLTIRDLSGAAIINNVNMGVLPQSTFGAGMVHVELNYDLTVGATRLFINGKQLGSTQTGTGVRNTSIDLIRLNADETGAVSESGLIYRDLRIYNSVQHTADFVVFEPNQVSTTVAGLDYLEGETVNVLADGNYIGDYAVSSGEITLSETYETVIVGLPYTHSLEIQPVDAGTGIGSAMGSIKRIDRAVLRFNNSAACKVGPDLDNQEELIFRVSSTPMGDPVELVTDDREVDFRGDYDRQARLVFSHNVPLPCSVTCISLRGITADV